MDQPLPDTVTDNELASEVTENFTVHTYLQESENGPPQSADEIWKRKEHLGSGSYGTVWLETCTLGKKVGQYRAVKMITYNERRLPFSLIVRELDAIGKFSRNKYRHRFVRSFGWYRTDSTIFVAMEYMPLGDLDSYLDSPFPESETRDILHQLLEGLSFMHESKYVHRDLKPKNVLVQVGRPNWYVKIADFGISKKASDASGHTVDVGSHYYMAPETMKALSEWDKFPSHVGQNHVFAVDIWALGTMAWRMMVMSFPFQTSNDLASYVKAERSPSFDRPEVSEMCSDFIKKALAVSAPNRLTSTKALEHRWIRDGNSSFIRRNHNMDVGGSSKNKSTVYGTWTSQVSDDEEYPVIKEPTSLHSPSSEKDKTLRPKGLANNQRSEVDAEVTAGSDTLTNKQEKNPIPEEVEEAPEVIKNLFKRGQKDKEERQFERAADAFKMAANEAEQQFGSLHPLVPTCLHEFALVLIDQEKFEEAETILKKCVSSRSSTLGEEHPSTLCSMHRYAWTMYDLKQDKEATAMFKKVISLRQKVLGQQHEDTLASMGGLAWSLNFQKGYKESLPKFAELLALRRQVLGPEHKQTLDCMSGIAWNLYGQKRDEEAESKFRELIAAQTRIIGPKHNRTLESQDGLALVLCGQGKTAEAEELIREVLYDKRKIFDKRSPQALMSMKNLASILKAQGRDDEATTISREIQEIKATNSQDRTADKRNTD